MQPHVDNRSSHHTASTTLPRIQHTRMHHPASQQAAQSRDNTQHDGHRRGAPLHHPPPTSPCTTQFNRPLQLSQHPSHHSLSLVSLSPPTNLTCYHCRLCSRSTVLCCLSPCVVHYTPPLCRSSPHSPRRVASTTQQRPPLRTLPPTSPSSPSPSHHRRPAISSHFLPCRPHAHLLPTTACRGPPGIRSTSRHWGTAERCFRCAALVASCV